MTRTRPEASTHIADVFAQTGTTMTAHARTANGKKNTPQKETTNDPVKQFFYRANLPIVWNSSNGTTNTID